MRSFSPVAYEYREVIQEQRDRKTRGKVFYFNDMDQMDSASGAISNVEEVAGAGIFVVLDGAARIRIDRIITLFGKPGAAFDEYDAYGNVCLECTGGYDI